MTCTWTLERDPRGDAFYATGCGQAHIFLAGTTVENEYQYCPYCGALLLAPHHEPAGGDVETDPPVGVVAALALLRRLGYPQAAPDEGLPAGMGVR